MPDQIQIADVTVTPIQYREREDRGSLRIDLTTTVTGSARDQLREIILTSQSSGSYVEVRLGRVEPLRMHFGKPSWSEHNGETRYRLTLVERSQRDTPPSGMSFLDVIEGQGEWIAGAIGRLEAMLELLREKGIISQAEYQEIRTPNARRHAEVLYRMHQVADAHAEWTE
jgi:hypothetical protein